MTTTPDEPIAEARPAPEATPKAETPARKPYAPPKLRRLGSVRELTLGSPAGQENSRRKPKG